MNRCESSRRFLYSVGLLWLLFPVPCGLAADEPAPTVGDPVPLLIRDEGVRRELRLSAEQIQRVDAVLDKWNERIFRLRMLSPQQHADEVKETLAGFRAELLTVLDAKQTARLEGLTLQAQGWGALQRPEIAARLDLTPNQQANIAEILEASRTGKQELEQSLAKGGKPTEVQRKLQKLKSREHEQITGLLTERQKQVWLDLVGPRFDLKKLRQVIAKAPELRNVTEWINSRPLTLAEFGGQVVALHFFAADCINCIHNYPHYQKWEEQLTKRGVKVIGIHTPETKSERDIAHVRQKLQSHGLTYAVAIDNDEANWEAWTNRMWPSTYLIDKQGNVRYWWYGELVWNGADGEKWMREKIDELLAESTGDTKLGRR